MKEQIFRENDIINSRYKVLSLIGQGGIGTTYRVRDITTDTIVVLKTLDLREVKDWKEIELFQREISALKNIRHPFIPDYYDNFELTWDSKTLYVLVMEYIDGKNLYHLVKEGTRFKVDEVKEILKDLLSILSYIHTINPPIIHRDINPKNIIRTPSGEIFLVDFGAVGSLVTDTIVASTSNTFVGTIGYMPPEQLYGKSFPGSDIYSLGVTMLFLLSGREPSSFNLKDLRLDYKAFVNISGEMENILDSMIEPDQGKRIQSAQQCLLLLHKERVRKEVLAKKKEQREQRKVPEEKPACSDDTISGLCAVDSIIEIRRRREEIRKKEKEMSEQRQGRRGEEKERREAKKAQSAPRRVFVHKSVSGVVLSVNQSPIPKFIRNRFLSDTIAAIIFFFGSLTVFAPLVIGFRVDSAFALFFKDEVTDIIMIFILYVILIVLVKLILSILCRFKGFHLVLTKKDNILMYKKQPDKPMAIGKKSDLTITLNFTGNPPGKTGMGIKAWNNISFSIGKRTLMDTGFNHKDAETVLAFCQTHHIKLEKYS
ncbi:MAG: serine/threonine protein kinase [Spirochaetales bacterium]|nr:serine/threonine protein kinase [Spirochaetales bacterium]